MVGDDDAWLSYPTLRKYFNKLLISEELNYCCGPAGVAPPKKGIYIVRPIYNLYGMGVGAKEIELGPDDYPALQPGLFWCEKFYGVHRSIDYKWDKDKFVQVSCFVGEKNESNEFVFKRWYRDTQFIFKLPTIIDSIVDNNISESNCVQSINIELIDNNIIEIHLRGSPDPDYDEFIPAFEGVAPAIPEHRIKKYKFIQSEDDGGGWLNPKRLGFYVRNY